MIRTEYALILLSTTLMKMGRTGHILCMIHCNKKSFLNE